MSYQSFVVIGFLVILMIAGFIADEMLLEKQETKKVLLSEELNVSENDIIYDDKKDTFFTSKGEYKVEFDGQEIEKIVKVD